MKNLWLTIVNIGVSSTRYNISGLFGGNKDEVLGKAIFKAKELFPSGNLVGADVLDISFEFLASALSKAEFTESEKEILISAILGEIK